MSANDVRNFMGYMWIQEEDGIITIGINEEGLADFDEITSVDLPAEHDKVEADEVCGTVETDDGPMDIYSPVSGTVIEVNAAVIDDPSLIQEDPFEEGWLIRVEAAEPLDEDEEEEEDDEDEEDSDEDDD
jgi:glycine cleavage system H protein